MQDYQTSENSIKNNCFLLNGLMTEGDCQAKRKLLTKKSQSSEMTPDF